MTTRALIYYNDPGHGWLAVDRADLDALGIADQITSYSYQKGNRVYLEEDLDAYAYRIAAHAAGWKVTTRDRFAKNYSSIRNFDHYRKAKP